MSIHNICFCGEIRKYQYWYFKIEKKKKHHQELWLYFARKIVGSEVKV